MLALIEVYMRWRLRRLYPQEDFTKIRIFFWAHTVFFFLARIFEIIYNIKSTVEGGVFILILVVLYRLYYKTIKELYYTYWTFSTVLIIGIIGYFSRAFFGYEVEIVYL